MFSPDVPQNVRTLFLSDLHLGFRLSNAPGCVAALDYFQPEVIYLVGDTIDVTRMSRVWRWNEDDQTVIDRLNELSSRGVQIRLLPGNHDPCFGRDDNFVKGFGERKAKQIESVIQPLSRLQMQEEYVHQTQSGKRLLVMHGDQVDNIDARYFGIPRIGSKLFDYLSVLIPNQVTLGIRNFFKLILTVPKKIESRAIEHARRKNMDGLVMGHLHAPRLGMTPADLIVGNTGDWVEHSSLILETFENELMLVNEGEIVKRMAI